MFDRAFIDHVRVEFEIVYSIVHITLYSRLDEIFQDFRRQRLR